MAKPNWKIKCPAYFKEGANDARRNDWTLFDGITSGKIKPSCTPDETSAYLAGFQNVCKEK